MKRAKALATFAEEWWRLYAVPNLAPKTLNVYADLWDRYVLPRLGGYPLRNLTPEVLARFRADLAASDVGDPTIRKLMSIVQGVLQRAVEWHHLTMRPAGRKHARLPWPGGTTFGPITTGGTGAGVSTRRPPPRLSWTDHTPTTFGTRSARC